MVAMAWRRSGRPSMESGISPSPMALTVRLPMGRCCMWSSSWWCGARSSDVGHRRARSPLTTRSRRGTHPVQQRVLGDRPGVSGTAAQRLAVRLAGSADVGSEIPENGTSSMVSTSISTRPTRYRPPTLAWGRRQRRKVSAMSPAAMSSRSSLLNSIGADPTTSGAQYWQTLTQSFLSVAGSGVVPGPNEPLSSMPNAEVKARKKG